MTNTGSPGLLRSWRMPLVALVALSAVPMSAAAQVRFAADPPAAEIGEVTYSGDIAAIFAEACVRCHQPESVGPMSLTSYEEVRAWAPIIREKVITREMPPFHLDAGVGIQEVKGDWRLSEEQVRTIAAWVDQGAPQGDPNAELPPVEEIARGYTLSRLMGREPDLIVKSSPYTVPAEGGDAWWGPLDPIGNENERWIQAIQVVPSDPMGYQVVHHADPGIRYRDETGELVSTGQGLLTEYALGKEGEIFPPDAARRMPAESFLNWDIHYYPKGVEVVDDQVEIGFWLYPEGYEPDHVQTLENWGLQGDIAIAPNGTAMTQGFQLIEEPIRIDSWQPHGHYRLAGMKLEALYPDAAERGGVRREILGQVSNFRATWQHSYIFEEDSAPLLPAGTVVVLTGWYDNTENNPLNPDPTEWVGRGSRTNDEMSHAWIAVTHLDEEDYWRLTVEREQRQQDTPGFADSDQDD